MMIKHSIFNGLALMAVVLVLPLTPVSAQDNAGPDLDFHVAPRPKCIREKQSDVQVQNLKGKVKTVTTTRYSAEAVTRDVLPVLKETAEEDYDMDGTLTGKRIRYKNSPMTTILKRTFDGKKNILTDFFYNSDSSYYLLTQYGYDSTTDALKAEYIQSYHSGSGPVNTVKKYDSEGNCIEVTNAIDTKEFTYDENGNCVMMKEAAGHFQENKSVTTYTIDKNCKRLKAARTGADTLYTTYKYDEKDSLVEEDQIDPIENTTTEITYKYDNKGNKTEENHMVNTHSKGTNGGTYILTYEYEYDATGNWTHKTAYLFSRVFVREERQIIYY